MTAVGLHGSVQQVTPPPPHRHTDATVYKPYAMLRWGRSHRKWLIRCSTRTWRVYLSSLPLTDRVGFPSYVRREGGLWLPPTSALPVSLRKWMRSFATLYMPRHTSERGNNCSRRGLGIDECRQPGIWTRWCDDVPGVEICAEKDALGLRGPHACLSCVYEGVQWRQSLRGGPGAGGRPAGRYPAACLQNQLGENLDCFIYRIKVNHITASYHLFQTATFSRK